MKVSRRSFLKTASATAILPNIITSHTWANKPSETINIGFIGVGKQSSGHLNFFLGQKDCRIVSVAEVAKVRLDDAINRVAKNTEPIMTAKRTPRPRAMEASLTYPTKTFKF